MVFQDEPMNPLVKARWTSALRSGKYAQTSSALHQVSSTGRDSFCCLGVLCAIAEEEGIVTKERDEQYQDPDADFWLDTDEDGRVFEYPIDDYRYVGKDGSGSTAFLPEAVREWAGIQDSSGTFTDATSGTHQQLTYLNDTLNMSFPQIADVIEAHF